MTHGNPDPDPISAMASLDEPMRRRLYDLVAGSEAPLGRDGAAAALGISRELAAFHLDRLVTAGLLETEYRRLGERRGPGAGRPAKLYRRAARDLSVSLPARDYGRAAELLADAIERVDDPAVLDAVATGAHERGRAAGAETRRGVGPRPGGRRLRTALIDALRDGGYEPVVELGTDAVRLRNCPYHDLAERHRDLTCGMNLAWADGLVEGLGVPGVRAVLAPAPGSCCVVFEPGTRVTDPRAGGDPP